MKATTLIIPIFFALFSFAPFSATAQHAKHKVNKTQVSQQKRIGNGIKNGNLTKKEVKALEKQQRSIHLHKKAAKADGKVTRRERASIRAHQKSASVNIAKKKHNKISRK